MRRNNELIKETKDLILTKNHSIDFSEGNNMNSVVISAVGTGKTRGFVKSNLLNKGCSFVVTDVKGDLLAEFHDFFENEQNEYMPKYNIQILNFKNSKCSMNWNPLSRLRTEKDIYSFATNFIRTRNPNEHDSFWNNAAINLLTAILFFTKECFCTIPCTIEKMLKILDTIYNVYNNYSEGKHRNKNPQIIEKLNDVFGKSSNGLKYLNKTFTAYETTQSTFATLNMALSPLRQQEIIDITNDDNIDFKLLGDERTILFVVLDDLDHNYDFLVSLLYNQMVSELYSKADNNYDFKLQEHVRFIMDDFANYFIPDINYIISTCRSRNISIELILQSESQLKNLYGDNYLNLISNCAYVYIGNNDILTQENIAKRLGSSITDVQNLVNMACIFFPEGKTIKDEKSDYLKHKAYKLLRQYSNHTPIEINKVKLINYSLIPDVIEIEYFNFNIEDLCDVNIKKDLFDSKEEQMFYETFQFMNTIYEVSVHTDLRDIFDVDFIKNKNLKYKLMLMHCDFIFRKNGMILAGLEIDGTQHITDENQAKKDKIKNDCFIITKIPLFRFEASEVRKNPATVARMILEYLDEITGCEDNSNDYREFEEYFKWEEKGVQFIEQSTETPI